MMPDHKIQEEEDDDNVNDENDDKVWKAEW